MFSLFVTLLDMNCHIASKVCHYYHHYDYFLVGRTDESSFGHRCCLIWYWVKHVITVTTQY